MEIERINENTVKFYISYMDIENRGFDREEIWYNRERSEQLFWQVMDEVNYTDEDFNIDGPLWIQVQALDKGLEIVVTKAKLSKDGQNLELPTEAGSTFDLPIDEKIESLLDEKFGGESENDQEEDMLYPIDEDLISIIQFEEFEDVIQLSHQSIEIEGVKDTLYHYQGKYVLLVQFDDLYLNEDQQADIESQLLEYGQETNKTIHLLEEYGKVIFDQDVFEQIRSYFPEK
ncbi:Adapter protein MecA 1 [Paraliobacillus sp. PM-2]|uniref:adaptor protein MecA n=1 Tax=Paraliobacillus sp. PM-2 TaxID=1462524 RepID=UPI00061BBE5E|nr:adaptor protein MecA [Paraliobacillus sp. PM-2]CQR47997.1 Adapter protein MecA 1 [Paraliobacillus sp. PM-2]